MKKLHNGCPFSALFLLPVFICAMFSSCSPPAGETPAGESAPVTVEQMEEFYGMPVVTVLMDTPALSGHGRLTKTLERLPGYNRDFMVHVESLPYDGADRANAETRVRTEMMAGKGPDLFLCGSNFTGYWGDDFNSVPFFRFPQQAMNNQLLLPLDDYIENAGYMEWDKLLPVVMEAGRGKEGQIILPLAYSVGLAAFDKEAYTPPISLPCTWDEMLESKDPSILLAAGDTLACVLGPIADYERDTLLLSEEEMLAYAKKQHAMWHPSSADEIESLPGQFFCQMSRTGLDPLPMGKNAPEYWMIPTYNRQGGITAWVSVYAAINRNARYPDQAFKIIDYLLGEAAQTRGPVYTELFEGYPVYMGLGSEEAPLDGRWYMNQGNFQEYQKIVSQINQVIFPGPLEKTLHLMGGAHLSEKQLEKNVHESYMLIQMMLAES